MWHNKFWMKSNTIRLFVIVGISFFVGYYFGVSKVNFDWKNYRPQLSVVSKEPPPSLRTVDFSLFWAVWQKLEESYYDKAGLDPKKLVNGAINGMVQSLGDPYTMYLPPKDNSDFKEGLAGRFEGIGAQLGMKGNQIIVIAPLDGSPAEKAGIKPGDAIIKVEGKPTAGWTLNQAVEKIRGPKGTNVTLTIVKKADNKTTDVTIVRDTIHVKSLTGWVKPIREIESIKGIKSTKGEENKKVMYLRLSQFGDETNKEWLAVVNDLYAKWGQDKDLAGVVVDLRNNPGGYLNDATFIASEFIKEGVVVYQEKGNGERLSFNVSRRGILLDIPVVVLINKGSASASEIVAGALRDYKRAKLVGETSFGKGTIQEAEELGGGAGLHVTVAKWLTPNGTWVNGKGLTPDVAVALDSKDPSHDAQLEKGVEVLVQ